MHLHKLQLLPLGTLWKPQMEAPTLCEFDRKFSGTLKPNKMTAYLSIRAQEVTMNSWTTGSLQPSWNNKAEDDSLHVRDQLRCRIFMHTGSTN